MADKFQISVYERKTNPELFIEPKKTLGYVTWQPTFQEAFCGCCIQVRETQTAAYSMLGY